MTSLFHYNTLHVSLQKETKTLSVAFNPPCITSELVCELETLFNWASAHLEINSIFLTSRNEFFSNGLAEDELKNIEDQKLQTLLDRFQKLIYSMFFLPQTIIIDLKKGACGIAAELAIGADIRIMQEGGHICFNHLKKGFVPSCGGVGFLHAVISPALARNWVMSALPVNSDELVSSGFVIESYAKLEQSEVIATYLHAINNQAPIARIQTKRSFLEPIIPSLDKTLKFEKEFAIAGMCTQDWKNVVTNPKKEFSSAKELASTLKHERKELSH